MEVEELIEKRDLAIQQLIDKNAPPEQVERIREAWGREIDRAEKEQDEDDFSLFADDPEQGDMLDGEDDEDGSDFIEHAAANFQERDELSPEEQQRVVEQLDPGLEEGDQGQLDLGDDADDGEEPPRHGKPGPCEGLTWDELFPSMKDLPDRNSGDD